MPALHFGAMSLMYARRVAKWIWVQILTAVRPEAGGTRSLGTVFLLCKVGIIKMTPQG